MKWTGRPQGNFYAVDRVRRVSYSCSGRATSGAVTSSRSACCDVHSCCQHGSTDYNGNDAVTVAAWRLSRKNSKPARVHDRGARPPRHLHATAHTFSGKRHLFPGRQQLHTQSTLSPPYPSTPRASTMVGVFFSSSLSPVSSSAAVPRPSAVPHPSPSFRDLTPSDVRVVRVFRPASHWIVSIERWHTRVHGTDPWYSIAGDEYLPRGKVVVVAKKPDSNERDDGGRRIIPFRENADEVPLPVEVEKKKKKQTPQKRFRPTVQ